MNRLVYWINPFFILGLLWGFTGQAFMEGMEAGEEVMKEILK